MTGALAHRGPDGDGVWADDRVALGHRRLAIIDRAGGHQPMGNEDGTCWIAFNGEVYNHHALRKELVARGHVFRTASDTEAIVHAYEEWGSGCVERLEGMFAFAVYDQRRREVLLARDRLGKKPLYYATFGDALHFASEIKALRQSPRWDGTVDLSCLEGYLSLGYSLAPATIYCAVRQLEPGHWMTVRDGQLTQRQYWDVAEFDTDARDEAALLDSIDTELREAVVARLESEVKLGAFLSGGIDSGLVVSYMAEALGDRLLTASVGFGSTAHNELDHARITATRFRTEHHQEDVAPGLHDVFDPIVASFDEPFADFSAIPTYYVSQAARRHVTVALTGDGGDESFSGYDFRYVPLGLESYARRVVRGPVLRAAARFLGAHWPRSQRLPQPLRVATLLDNVGRDPAAAYYADLCWLKPFKTRAIMGKAATHDPLDSPVYAAVTEKYNRCTSASLIQRAQYADLKVYLPNDVLTKVDRMSMAHSLEIRCPLLDRRIVELAFRIPTSRKMPRLKAKRLLRGLAARRLPAEIVNLPKRGFTAPIGDWIAGPFAADFESDVLGPASRVAGLLDTAHVRMLFNQHRRREVDHSYALWAVWFLERWSRSVSQPGAGR
jgi:asparagine synthase (glutamine-hydrolysing)